MSLDSANEAKATFDDVYVAPTPHAYVERMGVHGYEIGEQARPYCAGAAELLREHNGDVWPVQMLDVGCSYGIGSAFVRYGCSFDEIVAFFAARAPREYHAACQAMRNFVNVVPPACDVRCVGVDSSAPAIRFAVESGLLQGGIARDYEEPGAEATPEERAWFRSCNLMISTGAIGYIGEPTLDVILPELGKDYPGELGPLAVVTILRMFEDEPIQEAFEKHGFRFGPVPEARLPQRRFTDEEERDKVMAVLEERGLDTEGWESEGKQYADLYVAALPHQYEILLERMTATRDRLREEDAVLVS